MRARAARRYLERVLLNLCLEVNVLMHMIPLDSRDEISEQVFLPVASPLVRESCTMSFSPSPSLVSSAGKGPCVSTQIWVSSASTDLDFPSEPAQV